MRDAVLAEARAAVRELAQPCAPGERVKTALHRVSLATGLRFRRVQTFWRGYDCAVLAEELEALRAARHARLRREAHRLAVEQALIAARLAALEGTDAGPGCCASCCGERGWRRHGRGGSSARRSGGAICAFGCNGSEAEMSDGLTPTSLSAPHQVSNALMEEHAAAKAELEMHRDAQAVRRFARRMITKLAASRAKGRTGWQAVPVPELWRMLREHIEKGDPVDVANFAMMIAHNSETLLDELGSWRERTAPSEE